MIIILVIGTVVGIVIRVVVGIVIIMLISMIPIIILVMVIVATISSSEPVPEAEGVVRTYNKLYHKCTTRKQQDKHDKRNKP